MLNFVDFHDAVKYKISKAKPLLTNYFFYNCIVLHFQQKVGHAELPSLEMATMVAGIQMLFRNIKILSMKLKYHLEIYYQCALSDLYFRSIYLYAKEPC